MTQLAVVAFPQLSAATTVEALRERYDPFAGLLAAHVTLVFPFNDEIEVLTLRRHVEGIAADAQAFEISLTSLSAQPDGYVFLEVGDGAAGCVALHDQLYAGLLARHLSSAHAYQPHITIGRLADAALAAAARDEIQRELSLPILGTIGTLSIFRLHDAARGEVAFDIPLRT